MLAESTLSPQGAVLLGAIQICVIVITHDLEIAAQMDEVWMMRDGVLEREESFQLVAGKSADFSAAFLSPGRESRINWIVRSFSWEVSP